jgi:hypothetical protein
VVVKAAAVQAAVATAARMAPLAEGTDREYHNKPCCSMVA